MSTEPLAKNGPLSKLGIFYLVIVYIVWGSTYLAIRIAVREGAGFTPFVLGSIRTLSGGLILLALGALSRQRLKLSWKDFLVLASSGVLLWAGGNGLVMVGETRADSATAALIISGTPIYVMLFEAILDRKKPSFILAFSLLVGTAGIVVLSMPLILSGLKADLLSVVVFSCASLCWAGGTLIQSRYRVGLSPAVLSGYQLLFGGIAFSFLALLFNEPLPHPSIDAWMACGYLVVFGSLIAFTSYVQVLRLLPTRIVMTYSYVNPVIAIFLGWLVLGEKITFWTVGGAVLVLLGVSGVFRERQKVKSK